MKMSRKSTCTIKRRLRVRGTLWGGGTSTCDYPLHVIGRPELEGVVPKTYDHIKMIAGDFEHVSSSSIVTIETVETIMIQPLSVGLKVKGMPPEG